MRIAVSLKAMLAILQVEKFSGQRPSRDRQEERSADAER